VQSREALQIDGGVTTVEEFGQDHPGLDGDGEATLDQSIGLLY
jgi:hypothetical protein